MESAHLICNMLGPMKVKEMVFQLTGNLILMKQIKMNPIKLV